VGRIVQKVETIEGIATTFNYTYSLVGRLIQVKTDGVETESYNYDGNGNRTHVNGELKASYDAQDRLLTHGDFTFDYDSNGTLLTKTLDGEITTFDYDALGNLRGVILPDATEIEYVIDGQNRRVGKAIDNQIVAGYLYENSLNSTVQLDLNGTIVAQFIYGQRENIPAYMIKDDKNYRIIGDLLGSPRLIVDSVSGEIVQRVDYDTWGVVLSDTNPGFQPFGFAGGFYDGQTMITRFGARDYDASIGRWISKDPIGFSSGDSNIYSYVGGDPINYYDNEGTFRKRLFHQYARFFKEPGRVIKDVGRYILPPPPIMPVDPDVVPIEAQLPLGTIIENSPGASTTDRCNAGEAAQCATQCGGAHKVLGCYVTVRWKVAGYRGGHLIKSNSRTVNCRCLDECE